MCVCVCVCVCGSVFVCVSVCARACAHARVHASLLPSDCPCARVPAMCASAHARACALHGYQSSNIFTTLNGWLGLEAAVVVATVDGGAGAATSSRSTGRAVAALPPTPPASLSAPTTAAFFFSSAMLEGCSRACSLAMGGALIGWTTNSWTRSRWFVTSARCSCRKIPTTMTNTRTTSMFTHNVRHRVRVGGRDRRVRAMARTHHPRKGTDVRVDST